MCLAVVEPILPMYLIIWLPTDRRSTHAPHRDTKRITRWWPIVQISECTSAEISSEVAAIAALTTTTTAAASTTTEDATTIATGAGATR
jgi:hypothetical protein